LAFPIKLTRQNAYAGGVPAGAGQRSHETSTDHVIGDGHDRNRGSARMGCPDRTVAAQDRIGIATYELRHDAGELIVSNIEAAPVHGKILPSMKSNLLSSSKNGAHTVAGRGTSTPMRRIGPLCARAGDHATVAAALPSSVMNSRRLT